MEGSSFRENLAFNSQQKCLSRYTNDHFFENVFKEIN